MFIIESILRFLSRILSGSLLETILFYSAPVVTGLLLVTGLILYRFAKQKYQADPAHISAGRVKGLKIFMIVSAVLFGLTTLAVAAFTFITYTVMVSM